MITDHCSLSRRFCETEKMEIVAGNNVIFDSHRQKMGSNKRFLVGNWTLMYLRCRRRRRQAQLEQRN